MNLKVTMIAATCALATSATAIQANEWDFGLDLGMYGVTRTSSDTDIEDDPFWGGYVGGYAKTEMGRLQFAADFYYEELNKRDFDSDDIGELHSGALGLHLGGDVGPVYLGVYAAAGLFDGADEDGPMDGHTVGIEAKKALGPGLLYGQLGWVEAIGDEDDNEFKGLNAKIGYMFDVTERVSAAVYGEIAHSKDCFEDCGDDWGHYAALGGEVAYELNDRFDVVGGITFAEIEANTEDNASTSNLYLGIRMPLGNRPAAADRHIGTPIGGFRAAGWMEQLD